MRVRGGACCPLARRLQPLVLLLQAPSSEGRSWMTAPGVARARATRAHKAGPPGGSPTLLTSVVGPLPPQVPPPGPWVSARASGAHARGEG